MNTARSKAISKIGGAITTREGAGLQVPVSTRGRFGSTAHACKRKQPQSGFTLIELMIVLAILAILMALAVPAYTTYVARAKVTECLSAAGSMKMSIGETAMGLPIGTFPVDADQAGINPGAMVALEYCDAGLYANTGVLTLQVDEAAVGVGGTIEMVLVPTFNGTSSISWNCLPGATTGEAMRYLPAGCRS